MFICQWHNNNANSCTHRKKLLETEKVSEVMEITKVDPIKWNAIRMLSSLQHFFKNALHCILKKAHFCHQQRFFLTSINQANNDAIQLTHAVKWFILYVVALDITFSLSSEPLHLSFVWPSRMEIERKRNRIHFECCLSSWLWDMIHIFQCFRIVKTAHQTFIFNFRIVFVV